MSKNEEDMIKEWLLKNQPKQCPTMNCKEEEDIQEKSNEELEEIEDIETSLENLEEEI